MAGPVEPDGEIKFEFTTTPAERAAKYKKRRAGDKAEVRVAVWVPAHRAAELRGIASAMRAEADIAAGRASRRPPIVIPKAEVPEVPPAAWVWLKLKPSETTLRLLLKANGARWCKDGGPAPETWRIREDVAERLGLLDPSRVRFRAKTERPKQAS